MRTLDIGMKVYDCKNYRFGKIVAVNTDNNTYTLKDDDYNQYALADEYVYVVDEELSNKYGITICKEHNQTEGEYPYYIPIADENAYEIELVHFAEMYS